MKTQINLHMISLDHVLIKFFSKGETTMNLSTTGTQLSDAAIQIDIERSPQDNHQSDDDLMELEILMRPA